MPMLKRTGGKSAEQIAVGLALRENVVGQICKFCGQELKTDESKAREENSRTIENRLRVANNLNPR